MMAVRTAFGRRRRWAALAPCCALVGWTCVVAAGVAQTPPRPQPKPESEPERKPSARPPVRQETGPPPPVLLVSADMPCTLELDGQPLGQLEKDVVQRFVVREGDHLLQAFPLEVEGPTWKESVKAPETGQVAVTIELREMVEEWHESQEEQDRFEVRDRLVIDRDTGLIWMRNVSPEMTWQQAQGYCAGRELDGLRGWRLPVLDELSTLQFDDHESPRQEMAPGDVRWTIFGRRREDTDVLPRLIHPALDHNSVAALWIDGELERTACSFLGGYSCEVLRRKKDQAAIFCVRPLAAAEASEEVANGGR